MSDKLAGILAKARAGTAAMPAAAPEPLSMAEQRANVIEWALKDRANTAWIIDQIGRDRIANTMQEARCDVGKAMPQAIEVTAAQCSLFDNWPNFATKGKPNRNHKGNSIGAKMPHYQCDFELWTVPAGVLIQNAVNSAFQGVAPLLDHAELTKRIAKLRNEERGRPWRAKTPEDAQGAALEAFGLRLLALSQANPGKLYGPVFLNKGGTKYFLEHFASADAATIGTPAFEVELHREGFTPVVFKRFASTYSNGSALKGNVVGHSRVSRRADHSAWRTAFL